MEWRGDEDKEMMPTPDEEVKKSRRGEEMKCPQTKKNFNLIGYFKPNPTRIKSNRVVYLAGTVSYGITTYCASFEITRLSCVSYEITRLMCVSDGITQLICASYGITKLMCVSYGITRMLCCRAKVTGEVNRQWVRRIRERHMGTSIFNASA
ncbi:hypothetical protein E5676_scaffold1017G00070 [Cucumis melo var. makuwa]|uniref:Gag/pol protein n=1 Tax=Cucumis melo var. makuwa TaxID=1194695 RepID=A0A5D3CJL2_CUCMM|nr:hypothetical protein E5676_scaffold1017G00070 [Cucumis melo var. makuwa]